MKYGFFQNKNCEDFPCHKVKDTENFNCLFCFCPLYHLKDCGGNYKVLGNGIKDCSKCVLPHYNYGYVIDKIKSHKK